MSDTKLEPDYIGNAAKTIEMLRNDDAKVMGAIGHLMTAKERSLSAVAADTIEALVSELSRRPAPEGREAELEGLLRRALPSVEADAQMMDAMDRHAPLPEADMPSVTAAADRLDTLAAEIRAVLADKRRAR